MIVLVVRRGDLACEISEQLFMATMSLHTQNQQIGFIGAFHDRLQCVVALHHFYDARFPDFIVDQSTKVPFCMPNFFGRRSIGQ